MAFIGALYLVAVGLAFWFGRVWGNEDLRQREETIEYLNQAIREADNRLAAENARANKYMDRAVTAEKLLAVPAKKKPVKKR